ncbi:hypothetical protein LEP1GSC036_0085 [Leptospira weilii str. 2006001853]|uniref:Uncharacterized protein n=3 Tax=Leptospira weilii TaxID=28184 RepID=A0A828YVZ6_9LEPT|nr:hypothetical protein LEP1GSC036_0085 [Leptospira weilii str. 2006001853]EMJ61569.1 hypothetical protein LEP1GSC051_3125 [Leptospira sp. P2653]EMN46050.1 hypothetical protein LEP1GSC086_2316 [Leptospira weilii str. LNT 1234]EMN91878.1 hypothetical protein LEP1GSC108_1708 [Leptospira weilii str. UI 13098]EMY12764.1 hypothetical protein LEP1GSC043_1221 [Leptospira weilii str. Ecochallenge]
MCSYKPGKIFPGFFIFNRKSSKITDDRSLDFFIMDFLFNLMENNKLL